MQVHMFLQTLPESASINATLSRSESCLSPQLSKRYVLLRSDLEKFYKQIGILYLLLLESFSYYQVQITYCFSTRFPASFLRREFLNCQLFFFRQNSRRQRDRILSRRLSSAADIMNKLSRTQDQDHEWPLQTKTNFQTSRMLQKVGCGGQFH